MKSKRYKAIIACLVVCCAILPAAGKNGRKPKRSASGIKLVFEDGYAFKDLNRNGRLGIPTNKSSDPRHGTTADAEFNAGVATYRKRNHP